MTLGYKTNALNIHVKHQECGFVCYSEIEFVFSDKKLTVNVNWFLQKCSAAVVAQTTTYKAPTWGASRMLVSNCINVYHSIAIYEQQ
jgi:hypothetical protein